MLYEVAVVQVNDQGNFSKILVAPTAVLAKDEKVAGAIVYADNKSLMIDCDESKVTILTRPFA